MDVRDIFIKELQIYIQKLEKRLEERDVLIEKLTNRIDHLEAEIHQLKTGKNSSNSSMPPSSDMAKPASKPNQSLRLKSDKKSGGQPGHKGETLKMSALPDRVEKLLPLVCPGCNQSLDAQQATLVNKRQVVDIPPIKPIFTQYEQYERTCPCCNLSQKAPFPAHVQAPVQYGPNVMSTLTYLHTRQFVPLKRTKELMNSLFGLPISEGSIVNIIDNMVEKAMSDYRLIKKEILASFFAGADETGCKVNGKKQWFWTLQNELNTFIWLSHSRGFDAIQEEFADNLKELILIHDCWAAYFQTGAQAHQLCLAHLNRDLTHLSQLYPDQNWAQSIKTIFYDALAMKKEMVQDPSELWIDSRTKLEENLKKWIQIPLEKAGKEVIKLQKRLKKHLKHLTTFLHHLHIPPDNNGSERAIRNIKVKQKVSGQFKTAKGADSFAVLRSVIDTCIKRDKDVFQYLVSLATALPE